MTTADRRAADHEAADRAPACPPTGAGTPAASEDGIVRHLEAGWQRVVVWWDVALYAVLALTAIALLLTGQTSQPRRLTSLGALAVLLIAYLLLGRRAARTREPLPGLVYLVVLIVTTTFAVWQSPVGAFLLFAAFTQIWMLSDRPWRGVVLTVVLAGAVTVAFAAEAGLSVATVLAIAPQMGVVLVFSVGMGLWVASSMRRTEQLAVALDELRSTRAALADAHRAEGVAAERERMAQEIHDTLAQGFTSVVMLSQTALGDLDHDRADAARDRITLVEQVARDNLAEARALVAAFAPVPLGDVGLAPALHRLAERFEAETSVAVTVAVPEDAVPGRVGPPRAVEVVLLRTAQEALANVRRHAGAGRVGLSLTPVAGGWRLEVTDDGRGLGDAVAGVGLAGMRRRIEDSGGELTLGPGDGGTGTRVTVVVPAEGAG